MLTSWATSWELVNRTEPIDVHAVHEADSLTTVKRSRYCVLNSLPQECTQLWILRAELRATPRRGLQCVQGAIVVLQTCTDKRITFSVGEDVVEPEAWTVAPGCDVVNLAT